MDTKTEMSNGSETVGHSPLPWESQADLIYSPTGKAMVAAICEPYGSEFVRYKQLDICSPNHKEAFANAALIIQAVNNYSALKEENERLKKSIENEAARRAYEAGLGVSEWEAFVWNDARELLGLSREGKQ